jgi:hypothetical protein
MQLLGAATAAPRRFVVREAGVQVNGRVVSQTNVYIVPTSAYLRARRDGSQRGPFSNSRLPEPSRIGVLGHRRDLVRLGQVLQRSSLNLRNLRLRSRYRPQYHAARAASRDRYERAGGGDTIEARRVV